MTVVDQGSGEKVNVLLVDDRPDGLIALQAVFAGCGYNLVTAMSGQEALARLFDDDFAVILLDVQMPGMDGFETAAVIKQRNQSKHIPIIFVTAINKHPHYVYQGYEAGAVDYVFKPFDPHILKSKVAVFVDLYLKNRKLTLQTQKLRQSEERYRLLVETAHDFIGSIDLDGKMISMSPAFEAVTGRPVAAFVGKHYSEIFHPADVPVVDRAFENILQKQTLLFEARLQSDGERTVPMEFSAKPFLREGHLVGALAVGRDITERLAAEDERRRRSDLERSNRELEQFAHICSHDLQEPLRMVASFTQLLEKRYKNKLDAQADESIAFIMDGTNRMSQLIRDLLDYSRLGAPKEETELVSCNSVLEQVIRGLHIVVNESNAKVLYGDMPNLRVNRVQLAQVFQNLFTNAIKFRSSDTPTIEVSAHRNQSEWVICVKDNGIGLEMEYAERIFLIFKRLHRKEEYPGTGMGLAICKKIIERHGGRIWVESNSGGGATFYFTLPAEGPAPEPPAVEIIPGPLAAPDAEPPEIHVGDDRASTRPPNSFVH